MKVIIVSICLSLFSLNVAAQINPLQQKGSDAWFQQYNFNPASFKNPIKKFGPLTRWWWPGNDVTNEQLQREVKLLAEHGFSGVEIQPFASGLNPKGPQEQLQRQMSWDAPSFYEHLRIVLEQARKDGMTVDLNAGSGWPIGGPFITPDSSLLTLTYADTLVNGSQNIVISIPRLKQERFTVSSKSPFSFTQTVSTSFAKLQAVILAKWLRKENGQTFLDSSTIQNVTSKVVGNRLALQLPEGTWQILSFWSMPDGELPKGIAAPIKGFVIDHLDSNKLKWSYNYLIGARTGLQPYFGNPLRAIFNDSYEFMADRHYSANFISYFRQQRGYDITPYLPVNMKKFYNNAYIAPFTAAQPFDFVLSNEDWRLRYDYDLTVSDLLKTQFIQPSNEWMNERGLKHRNQAYGARMDVIGGSGEVDIPETEQLAGNNSEGFLKLVTSGAHLNNKPVITQESFVFRGLAEMTTPQKIRLLADKSFAAGVNQIIYHGTPYKYQTGEFGKEGWSPFSSPFSPTDNFSSTINESSPFWKDIKPINQYIARSQYILQAGRPKADVLIYFPFIDFYPEQINPNPNEILVGGYFKGVEPVIASGVPTPAHSEKGNQPKQWFAALWPLVNKLEASGITWDFVNDVSLQKASMQQGEMMINGNKYSSLILSHLPYMHLATAEKINKLSKAGCRLLVYGEAPVKQPSFLNFKEKDEITKQFVLDAFTQTNVKQVKSEEGLDRWISLLPLKLKFSKAYDFTRSIERQMSHGSLIKFIWNQSDRWQTVSLSANGGFKNFYWMDAEKGTIVKNRGEAINYLLPPYSSIFLYAAKNDIPSNMLSPEPADLQNTKDMVKLENWNIKIGDIVLNNSNLFDWKSNDALKYSSDKGIYTTSFQLKKEAGKKYLLDLGTVYCTADVLINGKSAGKRMWAPYQLDITSFIKTGENRIEVYVTPTFRNEFIGEAVNGNSKYAQFKRKEKTLMSAGLVGPVSIKVVK